MDLNIKHGFRIRGRSNRIKLYLTSCSEIPNSQYMGEWDLQTLYAVTQDLDKLYKDEQLLDSDENGNLIYTWGHERLFAKSTKENSIIHDEIMNKALGEVKTIQLYNFLISVTEFKEYWNKASKEEYIEIITKCIAKIKINESKDEELIFSEFYLAEEDIQFNIFLSKLELENPNFISKIILPIKFKNNKH